jgi:hypothetical protein
MYALIGFDPLRPTHAIAASSTALLLLRSKAFPHFPHLMPLPSGRHVMT